MASPAQSENVTVGTVKKYPVSEVFTSIQGEGLFQGCQMTFVRLAGCSVGKRLSPLEAESWALKEPDFTKAPPGVMTSPAYDLPQGKLPAYTEKCCSALGQEFLCDTDFRTKEVLTVEEILARVPDGVRHLCITGGEPLNHRLWPLICEFGRRTQPYCAVVHIETSGTVPLSEALVGQEEAEQPWPPPSKPILWVTVSPKLGALPDMLRRADEIKFLVDEHFDLAKAEELLMPGRSSLQIVWLQPINHEWAINHVNVRRCLDLLQKKPTWRLSLQIHKICGVR